MKKRKNKIFIKYKGVWMNLINYLKTRKNLVYPK